jgi:hypothetical protein
VKTSFPSSFPCTACCFVSTFIVRYPLLSESCLILYLLSLFIIPHYKYWYGNFAHTEHGFQITSLEKMSLPVRSDLEAKAMLCCVLLDGCYCMCLRNNINLEKHITSNLTDTVNHGNQRQTELDLLSDFVILLHHRHISTTRHIKVESTTSFIFGITKPFGSSTLPNYTMSWMVSLSRKNPKNRG